jgi:hypothetical protein
VTQVEIGRGKSGRRAYALAESHPHDIQMVAEAPNYSGAGRGGGWGT